MLVTFVVNATLQVQINAREFCHCAIYGGEKLGAPKCSTIQDWLYKLWYILEREFYGFIKNDVEIYLLT